MGIIDGAARFQARRQSGTPRVEAYDKLSSNVHVIRGGMPLVKASNTQAVDLPAVTSGLSTADKILGFAVAQDRLSATTDLPMGFAQFPGQNNPDGNEQMEVYVADGVTEFSMGIDPAVAVTVAMQGTVAGLKQQSSGQWTLDTASPSHTPILITTIDPDMIGVLGGQVNFTVPAANSQFLAGN